MSFKTGVETDMAKKSGGGCNLYSGLSKRAPSGVDKSMSIPSGSSVDKDTTRDKTAPTPSTIGGRTA